MGRPENMATEIIKMGLATKVNLAKSQPAFGALGKKTAWCTWQPNTTFYVCSLPIRNGKHREDWGYTDNPSHAIPLSVYWQRRFASDMRNARRDFGFQNPEKS